MKQTREPARRQARDASATRPAFDDEAFPFRRYVEQRTVVLDGLKVLYLPLPKAACTSMLWLLAELAGVPSERFRASRRAYATPSMTVHDRGVWGSAGLRLADFTGEERQRVLTEGGWLRFTLVRDPAARLWSAWQSKILLREPRFLHWFGDRHWFARVPDSPATVLEDFHGFLAALRTDHAGAMRDVHWAQQHLLANCLPFDHVGRVERLDDTLAALRAHVGEQAATPDSLTRENAAPLPGGPPCFAGGRAAWVRELYATDFDEYGYSPPAGDVGSAASEEWRQAVEERLPMIPPLIDRHERLVDLHGMMRGAVQERDTLATSLRGTRRELRQERDAKRAARRRARAAAAERDRLRAQLRRLRRSTSWKITRPLRVVGGIVKRRR